jgi:hypothetical protein
MSKSCKKKHVYAKKMFTKMTDQLLIVEKELIIISEQKSPPPPPS